MNITDRIDAPPCFFALLCLHRAAMEKAGRAVCLLCATRLRGFEYPLRGPSLQPLYLTGRTAAEALDMLDTAQDTRHPSTRNELD